jgi:hypothetical protein
MLREVQNVWPSAVTADIAADRMTLDGRLASRERAQPVATMTVRRWWNILGYAPA